jgi:hypothetical protein
MEDKIVFDKDMWNTLISMLLSPDIDSRNLAMGMLEGVDYLNQDQMSSFENLMHDFLGLTKDNAPGKGKLVHLYFSLLSKANRI